MRVEHRKRCEQAKPQGFAAAGSPCGTMFLFKTKVTFLLKRYQKPFVDPFLATLVGFGSARQYGFPLPFITKAARLPSTSTTHTTPDGVLCSAQDDTGRKAPLRMTQDGKPRLDLRTITVGALIIRWVTVLFAPICRGGVGHFIIFMHI